MIGILAIQGNFAEHVHIVQSLKKEYCLVRDAVDLANVTHLIIPGGESTAIMKFFTEYSPELRNALMTKVQDGSLALFATCAGAIVCAKTVVGDNAIDTLGLLGITIDRNAYGRQVHSFEADLTVQGVSDPMHVSFIRAPIIKEVGDDCTILAEHEGNPVVVQQGKHFVMTCHPELHGNTALYELWLS